MLFLNTLPIQLEKRENLGIITINRPKYKNVFNYDTLSLLDKTINNVEENSTNYKGIIITGIGEGFSAGADIKEIQTMNLTEFNFYLQKAVKVLSRLTKLPIPVVAAINGFAIGGGLVLTMACDIRIASKTAFFCFPEVGFGLLAGWGGTQRLVRLTGYAKALELIISGRSIMADEAQGIGLINKVVLPEKLMSESINFIKEIETKAPAAVALAKRLVYASTDLNLDDSMIYEAMCASVCFFSEDAREGIQAFIEKRRPTFRGK